MEFVDADAEVGGDDEKDEGHGVVEFLEIGGHDDDGLVALVGEVEEAEGFGADFFGVGFVLDVLARFGETGENLGALVEEMGVLRLNPEVGGEQGEEDEGLNRDKQPQVLEGGEFHFAGWCGLGGT